MKKALLLNLLIATVVFAQPAVEHGIIRIGKSIQAETFRFAAEAHRLTVQLEIIEFGNINSSVKPTPDELKSLSLIKARELRDLSMQSLKKVNDLLNNLDDECKSVMARGSASAVEIRQLSMLILRAAKDLNGVSSDPDADELQRRATVLDNDGDLESARRQAQALRSQVGRTMARIEFISLKLGAISKAGNLENSLKDAKQAIINGTPNEADLAPYEEAAGVLERMAHKVWK